MSVWLFYLEFTLSISVDMHRFIVGVIFLDKCVSSLDDHLLLGLQVSLYSFWSIVFDVEVWIDWLSWCSDSWLVPLCVVFRLLNDRNSSTIKHWNVVSIISLMLLMKSILIRFVIVQIFSIGHLIRLVCPQLYWYTSVRFIVSDIIVFGVV